MRYPIVLEPGSDRTAWGVIVPDLPRRVLHRLDTLARRAGETRSGFIACMAVEGRDHAAHA